MIFFVLLIPTFANVKLSTKGKNNKLKQRIARIKRLSIQLKSALHIMIYSVLFHKANLTVKSKSKVNTSQ